MKKSNLVAGIVYVIVGVLFLIAAILTDSRLGSLFFGFACAGIVPGLGMICKYLYWTKPEKKEKYKVRLENEKIELHDEMKEKLRDKSGRYSYVIGLIAISISILIFSMLGTLGVIDSRIIVLFLGGYLLLQIIIGIAIFDYLLKKYK